MTAEVGFEVQEAGEPKLSPEGEEPETPEQELSGPAALVVMQWTPEEASALLSALFNIGVLVYGTDWAAHPMEFRASGIMAAPLLDRFVPKAVGGPVQTGVGLIAVAGELAGATARRWPIIKRGPRPVWQARPGQAQAAPEAAQPAPPPAAEPAAATSAANGRGAGGYHFDKETLKVIPRPADQSMGGMGYQL